MFINRYDQGMHDVEQAVAGLTDDVRGMLADALTSLFTQDLDLAQRVMQHDDMVDEETARIEEEALQLISLQQPRQEDLRILIAALRNVRDLERIGDYACDIAEVALILGDHADAHPLVDLRHLGDLTLDMVQRAHQAVTEKSFDLAHEVNRCDDAVDALYLAIHRELMHIMRSRPALVEQSSYLSLVARYLERIADHAVNIAEMTIYRLVGNRRPFRKPPPPPTSPG